MNKASEIRNAIMLKITEMEPSDPSEVRSITVDYDDLYEIIESILNEELAQ